MRPNRMTRIRILVLRTLADIVHDWPLWGVSDQPLDASAFAPLSGGLTNQNYRLTVAGGTYVLRIAAENGHALGLDRMVEYQVHQHMAQAGLVPAVLYHDPQERYWLRHYQVGEHLSPSSVDHLTLCALAQVFQRVHAQPVLPDLPRLRVIDKAAQYWAMIQARVAQCGSVEDMRVWQALASQCQQQIQTMLLPSTPLVICHLDPIADNWLHTEQGWQLLDWEYAAAAHPLLDLASLSLYLNLSSDQQQTLCHAYGVDDSANWCKAQSTMRYLHHVWYGAQGLWTLAHTKQSLLHWLQRPQQPV